VSAGPLPCRLHSKPTLGTRGTACWLHEIVEASGAPARERGVRHAVTIRVESAVAGIRSAHYYNAFDRETSGVALHG